MGKVVHLDDGAHQAAKEFCAKHGIPLKEWVEKLISEGVQQFTRIDQEAPESKSIIPVETKPIPLTIPPAPVGVGALQDPPFWETSDS